MLRLALFFLVVSLIAALFGFGGISAAAADIARILFFVAIVIFLVTASRRPDGRKHAVLSRSLIVLCAVHSRYLHLHFPVAHDRG